MTPPSADSPARKRRPPALPHLPVFTAVVVATAVLSGWAVAKAHDANPPISLPPAPPHNAAGTAWAVVSYAVWLLPMLLAVRWWRWRGLVVAIAIGALAVWFVPALTESTRTYA